MPGVIRLPARAGVQTRQAGRMNSLERRYAELLEGRRLIGEIAAFWFESITLRIGERCTYCPDFLVQLADGTLEIHEVKGGWFRDDAKVKLRAVAEAYPFRIQLARWLKDYWQFEDF